MPAHLTAEDKAIFARLVFPAPARGLSYAEHIDIIRLVQSFVTDRFPNTVGVPEYQPREPEDLLAAGGGWCFDRARFIEKLLKFHGFEARHVFAIFLNRGGLVRDDGLWRALVRRGSDSHALIEVRTSRGWTVVESNDKWISPSPRGEPVGMNDLKRYSREDFAAPSWFDRPFVWLIVLYSGGGQFSPPPPPPPFFPGPEFNWREVLSGLSDCGYVYDLSGHQQHEDVSAH